MNNSYITIIKEKRTDWSRKHVPLNQNECTADFRIGVPFKQNLQILISIRRTGDGFHPGLFSNVAQQLQDSAAADLSPAAWQNAQKSL